MRVNGCMAEVVCVCVYVHARVCVQVRVRARRGGRALCHVCRMVAEPVHGGMRACSPSLPTCA